MRIAFSALCLIAVGVASADTPETADGLKAQIETVLVAFKSDDGKAKRPELVKSLILPEHDAWFKKVFGDDRGKKLAEQYGKDIVAFEPALTKVFEALVKSGRTDVSAWAVGEDGKEGTGAQKAAIAVMTEKAVLYSIRFVKTGEEAGTTIWSFVYSDGSFRLIGKLRTLRN